jgi:AhpD family alkylhydroperoxidase
MNLADSGWAGERQIKYKDCFICEKFCAACHTWRACLVMVAQTLKPEIDMTERLNPFTAAADAMKPWMALSENVAPSLDPDLRELVKIRASQINHCANCLNMHTRDARKAGETEQRIYVLSAWREAPYFTSKERAALAWTEALTQVAEKGAPDDVHAALDAEFSQQEQVELTMLINVINGWNRLAVGFGLFYK